MPTFQERLKSLIGPRPYAWAAKHNWPKGSLQSLLEETTQPQRKTLDRLVEVTGCSREWLEHGIGEPFPGKEGGTIQVARNVPTPPVPEPAQLHVEGTVSIADAMEAHYAEWAATVDKSEFIPIRYFKSIRAAAGHGAVIESETADALLFRRDFVERMLHARPSQLALIRVTGDSMQGTLASGSTVMIHVGLTGPLEGVYVIRANDALIIKRLQTMPGGVLRVISDNKAYPAYEVDPSKVPPADFQVLGKVVWNAGML